MRKGLLPLNTFYPKVNLSGYFIFTATYHGAVLMEEMQKCEYMVKTIIQISICFR